MVADASLSDVLGAAFITAVPATIAAIASLVAARNAKAARRTGASIDAAVNNRPGPSIYDRVEQLGDGMAEVKAEVAGCSQRVEDVGRSVAAARRALTDHLAYHEARHETDTLGEGA